MGKTVVRVIANVVILVGFFFLARVLYYGLAGDLAQRYFAPTPGSPTQSAYAFFLSLPIPFHIIAVGLVLQLKWLSPLWRRAARWAVVISGCWLGLALAVRWLAL
jgi:hypothetical protein